MTFHCCFAQNCHPLMSGTLWKRWNWSH